MEGERSPESPKQPEYNFEEGIAEVIRRIREITETQKYMAIAVIGSDMDVGKTTTATQLSLRIQEMGIDTAWVNNVRGLFSKPYFAGTAGMGSEGGVLIFHDERICSFETIPDADSILAEKAQKFGLPISKTDLRIYVYRPDRPFSHPKLLEAADIIIRNEKAIDKHL